MNETERETLAQEFASLNHATGPKNLLRDWIKSRFARFEKDDAIAVMDRAMDLMSEPRRRRSWPYDMTTDQWWQWIEASVNGKVENLEPQFVSQFIANLFDDYRYVLGREILCDAEVDASRRDLLKRAEAASGCSFRWADYARRREEKTDDDIPF